MDAVGEWCWIPVCRSGTAAAAAGERGGLAERSGLEIRPHGSINTNEKEDKEKKMTDRDQYTPGPASGAEVRKDGEKWTLILVGELRHSSEKVWHALTDPAHLREWAPFEVDGSLGTVGTVKLTWVGTPQALETRVTRADAPKVLEYNDTR